MIPCASVSKKRARISVVEAYGTRSIFPQAAGDRGLPRVSPPRLGEGALERLLVEHALASRADLPLDLVRDTAALANRAKSHARVLVRLSPGLLHGHLLRR